MLYLGPWLCGQAWQSQPSWKVTAKARSAHQWKLPTFLKHWGHTTPFWWRFAFLETSFTQLNFPCLPKYLKKKCLYDNSFHLAKQKPLGFYWKITKYLLYLLSYLQRHLPTTRNVHMLTSNEIVLFPPGDRSVWNVSGHTLVLYLWKPNGIIPSV